MNPTQGSQVHAGTTGAEAGNLRLFVFALFFIFGGITSLNDILIPKLRELFTLSYGEGMLVQSAFFAAYFFISLPAAGVVRRIGYMRTAAVGLLCMTAGCLLFVPASSYGLFGPFLAAIFVLAAGITIVQVVANPLISLLGPAASASSRLTFAQAFNSLGTTIFPYFGAILILGSLATADRSQLSGDALLAYTQQATSAVRHAYMGLAVALVVIALAVWQARNLLPESQEEHAENGSTFGPLRRPRFAFGALCIFLYVGAEVAIGSIIVNYLMQADVLGLPQGEAGTHVPYYWGGALVGRFLGTFVLRVISPGKVLAAAASIVILLLAVSAQTSGALSGYSLLAIGLFNSIMFPTIFTLASEGLGEETAQGSGILCVAIVGGAIVPPLTGVVADWSGLKLALWVPALCYAVIVAFGLYARRSQADG